ncbi:hypothetical protein [Sphingomonas sp. AX6]|uniref:hypothetical protein n=1 Tax=Sphingomonas sp. AX6 TaxID=2653171 RepID=UPI0012EF9536|nr:hypothetical protein [Sphingomonas sp. AX6]VXC79852.1 conserved hypothetical protein [Sphingomonas sp. AX6]
MVRFSALVALPVLLAACSMEDGNASEIALADNGVPVTAPTPEPDREPVSAAPVLQTMAFPDFDSANMLGAGCLFRAEADADNLLVINSESGVVKIDGAYVRLLPDPQSPALRYDARSIYRGGQYVVTIDGGQGDPTLTEYENAEWPATMTFAVERGTTQRFEDGLLSCGA